MNNTPDTPRFTNLKKAPCIKMVVDKRTEVWVPYDPDVNGYSLLENICGLSRRGNIHYQRPLFSVSNRHNAKLVYGLATRFGLVRVHQVGNNTKPCAPLCWGARAKTWPTCTCACHGINHGSGRPPTRTLLASKRVVTREEVLAWDA